MRRTGSLFAVMCVCVVGCDSLASSRQAFLHWDIRSSLGLPGGPTAEQLATGKPPLHSAEEIAVLDNAELLACQNFSKLQALYLEGARGGEAEKFAAAGYILSCAQARLGWAKGDASETLARLEQATKFADRWVEAVTAAYQADTVTIDTLIDASDAKWRSKIALMRLRSAFEQLGIEAKNLPAQVDPINPGSYDCGRS